MNPVVIPQRISLKNVRIFRFHSTNRSFLDPSEFLKSFMDTHHTLESQYRFAGKYCNPGTFFSLSEPACVYEMLHYHPDLKVSIDSFDDVQDVLNLLRDRGKPKSFFTGVASFDNVLDLCSPESLFRVCYCCFPKLPLRDLKLHTADLLMQLAKTPNGGDVFTDFIGQWAHRMGYKAIRFLGVRALSGIDEGIFERQLRQSRFADFNPFEWQLNEITTKASNLVVFYSSYLLESIKLYRFEFAGDDQRKELRMLNRPRGLRTTVEGTHFGPDILDSQELAWREVDESTMTPNPWYAVAAHDIEKLQIRHGGLARKEIEEICENEGPIITVRWNLRNKKVVASHDSES